MLLGERNRFLLRVALIGLTCLIQGPLLASPDSPWPAWDTAYLLDMGDGYFVMGSYDEHDSFGKWLVWRDPAKTYHRVLQIDRCLIRGELIAGTAEEGSCASRSLPAGPRIRSRGRESVIGPMAGCIVFTSPSRGE